MNDEDSDDFEGSDEEKHKYMEEKYFDLLYDQYLEENAKFRDKISRTNRRER